MQALRYIKSVPRYLAVRALGPYWSWMCYTSPTAVIELAEVPEPNLPGPGWVRIRPRLSGICGSDLATIQAKGSPYFSRFISSPFVFGHEVVGDIREVGSDVDGLAVGDRVVLEPVLCCTGQLSGPAVGEEEKARLVNEFAEREGIDLSQSYAYGDSHADLPMLNAVGHPVAINPDAALNKAAEREGYAINAWRLPD